MEAGWKITPLKIILDDLRGVRGSGTKKISKFQSGFLGIFWPEMNIEARITPKKRILDHPWPYKVAHQ